MPIKHEYKKVEPFDGTFVRAKIERETSAPVLGITEYPNKVWIFFDKELTSEQKAKLDAIMANPPTLVRYEFGALDMTELVESMVGVKPLRVDYDEVSGHATIDFEKPLTPGQEKALDNALRGVRRLKRRT